MPRTAVPVAPTRRAVFEPLVELAKARTVALVESGELAPDDGEFVLRALIDLECDGIYLFGPDLPADDRFYDEVDRYLAARVGPLAHDGAVLARASAERIAALAASEGSRVAQLLALPGAAPCGPALDRAVLELIDHQGGDGA